MADRLTSRRAATAVAAVLAAAGLLLIVLGLRPVGPRLEASSGGFVNADRPGINAHNSPAVAADPARPSVVAVADRIDTPRFSCSVSLSTNGGATWKPLNLPLAPGAPNCYWPDVAFDGEGRLLVLYSATGGRFNQPVGVWLQRFRGEAPDGPPVVVGASEAFHAHFAVDGRRVLVAWVQAVPLNAERPLGFEPASNPIVLTRSEDGGQTFSPPVTVSDPGRRLVQPSVVTDGAGGVVVGVLDLVDDAENYEARHEGQGGPPPDGHWRVVAYRSTDGGATFGPPVVVADRLPVPQRVIVDLMPGPSFARDPRGGALYAAWDAGRGDRRDVFVARSADMGATWGRATRLEPRPRSQFLPAVGVAPDGRVDVVFYDRSRDPEDAAAEVMVASSWDGGRTFPARAVATENPFDSRIGLASTQGIPQLGNQLAVLSRPDGFLALWSDTSRGTVDTNVQDLGIATVTAHRAGGRRWWLAATGATLMLAGALAAWQLVTHKPAQAA